MKNFIIGLCSILILILTGLTVATVNGRGMRETELSSTVDTAMEQSMRILTLDQKYQMDNEEEFISDFIQSALTKTDSKSSYEIIVHTIDIEKGILDVTVIEHYKQAFIPGKVTYRSSIVLEDYSDRKGMFNITFKKGSALVKQISVPGGDFMTPGMLPTHVNVSQWVLEQNGNVYTKDNISNVAITQDLTFVARTSKTGSTLSVRYHLNGGKDVASDTLFTSGDPAATQKIKLVNSGTTLGTNGLYDVNTSRVTPPTGIRS